MGALDRRQFLGAAAGAGLVAGALGASAGEPGKGRRRARNLIFLVADGMGIGTIKLADMYARLERGEGLAILDLLGRPDTSLSLIDTEPHGSLVPDSAASASAWSIGRRCANKVVSITPEGESLRPLFVRAADSGRLVGAVTNTDLWDVSVSAFFANAPRRTMSAPIGEQMLACDPHVLLGGGAHVLDGVLRREQSDVPIVRDAESLERASTAGGPLYGFFSRHTMAYELDRPQSMPSVSDMASTGLMSLSREAEGGAGYALVIEQAKVDHAAHRNDPGSLVREMLLFDDIVRRCTKFADRDGETLLVITTDHANANPGLTVYDDESIRRFGRLRSYRRSHRAMHDAIGDLSGSSRTIARAAAIVEEGTGVQLGPDDLDALDGALHESWCHAFHECRTLYCTLGDIMANHVGVGWVSPNHTSDHVLALARGPGSEGMQPLMHISGIHDVVCEALDLAAPA